MSVTILSANPLTGNAQLSTVLDVRFRLRDSNNDTLTVFSLAAPKTDSDITLTEQTFTDETGSNAGAGLYKISGTINIASNRYDVINQLFQSQGERFEMYALYKNAQVLSVPTILLDGTTPSLTTGFYSFVGARFPFVSNWIDLFGVRFSLILKGGGSNNTVSFALDGWALNVDMQPLGTTVNLIPYFELLIN